MSFGNGSHLHLIDGSGFIFRAYHALPPLSRSDGLPVGAVHGFCTMLLRYLENRNGVTHAAVVFDHSAETFRTTLYPAYKAQRPALPEDLALQLPLTRKAAESFGLACLEIEGVEADDVIATLARQAVEAGGTVTIISSDKDLMQLVRPGVRILRPGMKQKPDELVGPEEVLAYFGVPPERVVDVQALAGDSIDNVPGAPGIGLKTAAQLIQEYGDLDTLLARAGEIRQPKRRETLLTHADQIRLSRALVALRDDVPLPVSLDHLAIRDPDPKVLLSFLAEMEFRTLVRRVAERFGLEPPPVGAQPGEAPAAAPGSAPPSASQEGAGANPTAAAASPEATPGAAQTAETTGHSAAKPVPAAGVPKTVFLPFDRATYTTITEESTLKAWIAEAFDQGYVAIDLETNALDEMRAEIVGVALALAPGRAAYMPLAHRQEGLGEPEHRPLTPGQIDRTRALALIKPLLEDDTVLKIGQNIKFDAKVLARHGIGLGPIDDTMLLSYAQHAGLHGHGMDELSERYLGHVPIPIKQLIGSGKQARRFDEVPIKEATPYAAEDADVTLRLWKLLKPGLVRARVTTVYETLERPLVAVLRDMELAGIRVDPATLRALSSTFQQQMARLEAEIQKIAGQDFNPGSPKQLGALLFEKFGVPGGEKGKSGAWGTSAEVLEDIATMTDTHPKAAELAARVLDWRQLAKLKSTYTDALPTFIHPETGRVHTSYVIAGATTGRLASTDPNLQNIPVRTEEGRRIREAFIAKPGHVLVSLDYSQIELRILAHIADIPALKQAFAEGQDIHATTASQMFGVALAEITPELRRRAKAINFGVIYGISGYGLARNLRIPQAEAQAFIDAYFERFPGIRTYMDNTIAFAKEHGFVTTLFGRRIHTPEIASRGPRSGFARRAAINAPIQGTAADIIRRAMIRMPAAIADLPARMLLQVHDELLFEVKEEAADALIERARAVMEGAAEPAVTLSVPLVVDAGKGRTWAEAH